MKTQEAIHLIIWLQAIEPHIFEAASAEQLLSKYQEIHPHIYIEPSDSYPVSTHCEALHAKEPPAESKSCIFVFTL